MTAEVRHGARQYRLGCRCEVCVADNYAKQATWRRQQRGKTPKTHGLNGYNIYGCRCGVCKTANAAVNQRRAAERERIRRAVAAGLPRDYA